MAVRRAIANGNWSATGTWFGGVLPGNGDTVAASGFTVTIDQDVTIGGSNNPSVNAGSFVSGQWYRITDVGSTAFTSIGAPSNAVGTIFQATGVGSGTGVATALATITTLAIAAAGAAAGGGFTITTARAFSADVRGGTTTCLTVTGTASVTWTGQNFVGGTTGSAHGVLNNASAGTISLSLATISGGIGNSSNAIHNASTGNLELTSCTISGGNSGFGVNNVSTATVTVTSCTVSGGLAGQIYGIYNNGLGTIQLFSSTITGGVSGNAVGVYSVASGTITATSCSIIGSSVGATAEGIRIFGAGTVTFESCTLTAGSISNAFAGANVLANVTIRSAQYDHVNGSAAVYCAKYKIGTTPSLMQYRKALDGSSTFLTLYTADFGVFGNPAVTDVRSGVTYADGGLTGTCAVPAAGSVALGVPVDNTTGSAVLTPSAVQAALLPLL